jgi:hypothetical protein
MIFFFSENKGTQDIKKKHDIKIDNVKLKTGNKKDIKVKTFKTKRIFKLSFLVFVSKNG